MKKSKIYKNFKLYEHLICPDCQSKLKITKHLECTSCGRIFPIYNRLLNLLPKNLFQVDLAEEDFWGTDIREGIKADPLLALLHKSDIILHFYEKVLPTLKLEGKILEIGSGSCWLSSLIKLAFPNTYVIATDVAPNALIKGSQINKFLNSAIDYSIACKVESLPFENNFFDYVIGSAVLHHTFPEKAIHQIFRVLKNDGAYIGMWELAIPRILSILWGSRFGLAGHTERQCGFKEGNYSLNQWKKFFTQAGFKEVMFNLETDPQYKHYHWFINFYYKIISHLPELLIKCCLASNMSIIAKKEKII